MSTTNKSVQDAVLGYIGKESRGAKLASGKHEVKLVESQVLHSRVKWDGDEKANLPPFIDPTPQLGVMFRNEAVMLVGIASTFMVISVGMI